MVRSSSPEGGGGSRECGTEGGRAGNVVRREGGREEGERGYTIIIPEPSFIFMP